SIDELNSGNFLSAKTQAFIINARGDTLISAFLYSSFSCFLNSSSSVISASSNPVTCGIITQFLAKLAPEIFLILDKELTSTSPNLAKSIFGHGNKFKPLPFVGTPDTEPPVITDLIKDFKSSSVMRPLLPLPLISPKLAPNSRANLRIAGDAKDLAKDSSSIACVLFATTVAAGADDTLDAVTGAVSASAIGSAALDTVTASAVTSSADLALSPATSSDNIKSPSLTLEPGFKTIFFTTPAAIAGTSIVALSVSSITKLSSTLIVSPTFTYTSATFTSVLPPISGTFNSIKLGIYSPNEFL